MLFRVVFILHCRNMGLGPQMPSQWQCSSFTGVDAADARMTIQMNTKMDVRMNMVHGADDDDDDDDDEDEDDDDDETCRWR